MREFISRDDEESTSTYAFWTWVKKVKNKRFQLFSAAKMDTLRKSIKKYRKSFILHVAFYLVEAVGIFKSSRQKGKLLCPEKMYASNLWSNDDDNQATAEKIPYISWVLIVDVKCRNSLTWAEREWEEKMSAVKCTSILEFLRMGDISYVILVIYLSLRCCSFCSSSCSDDFTKNSCWRERWALKEIETWRGTRVKMKNRFISEKNESMYVCSFRFCCLL